MSTGSPSSTSPSAWYPDPTGRFEFRWFNGENWTADVSSGGVRSVDPLGAYAAGPYRSPAPAATPRRGMAITSLVLGLVGVGLAWLPFVVVIGVGAALTAIALGAVAMRRVSIGTGGGARAAMAGVVTGVLALVLATVGVAATREAMEEIDRYANPGPFTIELTGCRLDGATAVASGTITNDSVAQVRNYVIRVSIRRSSTELALARTDVTALRAGESATFTVSAFVGDIAPEQLRCRVDEVTGPLPFGLG